MKYMGSKSRIAKHIIPILQDIIDKNNITHFDDVFCGGLNVSDKIKCDNINAYDANNLVIALFEHLQNGGELLEEVPREVYNDARAHQYDGTYEDWYLGNIGFLSSYNGRGFSGGYAQAGYEKTKKGQRYRDYYQESKSNILKQVPFIKNIKLHCCDYREVVAQGHLIYCDPPYKSTKQYENSKDFDHEMFWETMRDWSKDNIVVISEMQAPDDFVCIWKQEVLRSIKSTDKSTAIEKLFIHKSNLDKI